MATHLEPLGIDPTVVRFTPVGEFASPEAFVRWLGWLDDSIGHGEMTQMLPIMGVDGSLSLSGQGTPAEGKVEAKTGTVATLELADDRLIIRAKALVGYVQSASGNEYRFALLVSNPSYDSLSDQLQAADDLAQIVVAIQQDL